MTEVIFGRHPVLEALKAEQAIEKVLIARGVKPTGVVAGILSAARAQGVPVQFVPRRALDARADGNHQGVMALVGAYRYADLDDLLAVSQQRNEPACLLALDAIQDVHNLGALLRTAEAVGAHGVIIPEHRAVGVTAAVRKASAGAIEHIQVARVTNLARALTTLKERGLWIVGLEEVAEAQEYHRADLTMPLVLVVGSEGRGLSRLVRETCDVLIRLPMRGQVSSLNAAVAGSVALYEVWRQRAARF